MNISEEFSKPQLTSMIHFLEIRDEESKKLDEQLKGEEDITSASSLSPLDSRLLTPDSRLLTPDKK